MSAPPFKSRIFNRVVESITAAWVSWFQEVGDFVGGVVTGVTSLFVEPNSSGNVSRLVMTTGASTAAYWTKLLTLTSGATGTARVAKTLRIISGAAGDVSIPVQFCDVSLYCVETLANGLEATISKIAISQAALFSVDDLMLVQGTAAAGEPIELWLRSNRGTSVYAVYEIVSSETGEQFTQLYNNGSTWTATTPSGGAVVTSDWASIRGVFVPTIEGSTAAGVGTYTAQTGDYELKNKTCTATIVLQWTAHTGTGAMLIAGLPFPTYSDSNQYFIPYINSLTYTGDGVECFISPSSTTINLIQYGSGAAASTVAMDSSAQVSLTFTYEIL